MLFQTVPDTVFIILLPLWAALCMTLSIAIFRLSPESLPKWESFPRAVIPGVILASLDLLWCIPNAMPILPNSLHLWLLPLAALLAALAWMYLDYLMARATGGFLILFAHFMLQESFALRMPAGLALDAFLLAAGTAGIFISAKPHLLRDFIRLVCKNGNWRIASCLFFAAFACLSALSFLIKLLGKP